jgi:hypothetical protein
VRLASRLRAGEALGGVCGPARRFRAAPHPHRRRRLPEAGGRGRATGPRSDDVIHGSGTPRVSVASSLSPVRRHSPTLPLLGDAEGLLDGRGFGRFGWAESEVVENPSDRELICEEGDGLHLLAAASADERIHLVDLGDEACPVRDGFIRER